MTIEEFIIKYGLRPHFVTSNNCGSRDVEKRQGWQRSFSSSDGTYHGLLTVNEEKSNFFYVIYKEYEGQELLCKIISNRFDIFLKMIRMLEEEYVRLS